MTDTTSREGTPQIYVPTLRRELLQRPVPETVLFVDPGLPCTDGLPGLYVPPAYPFSRAEAASVLAELLSIGENLDLTTPTGVQTARDRAAADPMSEAEKAELDRFAGRAVRCPDDGGSGEALAASQKVLLLTWDLEERLTEIVHLHNEVADALRPLVESLNGPDGEAHAAAGLADSFVSAAAGLTTAEADWRLTFAAVAPFLPSSVTLVTAHEGMRAAMLEAGMLHPLPEDAARDLEDWPEAVKSAMLWAKAPLWRVLGYAREPQNAPWLLAAPEILVCRNIG